MAVLACRALALLLLVFAAIPVFRPAAAEPVDLQLVLAADVSRSVDEREFQLQRQGYAAAFRDHRVLQAIRSGVLGRIAVSFVEWSGPEFQNVVIDWMVIGDEETAGLFSDRLAILPRSFANRTAIGAAIDFSMSMFDKSPAASERRVIDVSGDGTNTNGRLPTEARDEAVKAGVTINALVILSPAPIPWNPHHTHPPGGLPKYFEENVIGGPGSFLVVAEDFDSFSQAILSKLVKEIAATPEAARGLLAELPR
ncbi:MAG: DUF1194 domain-containing protein [Rhodospirillales bacterium]